MANPIWKAMKSSIVPPNLANALPYLGRGVHLQVTVHPPPHKTTQLMVEGSYIHVWFKVFKMGFTNVRATWLPLCAMPRFLSMCDQKVRGGVGQEGNWLFQNMDKFSPVLVCLLPIPLSPWPPLPWPLPSTTGRVGNFQGDQVFPKPISSQPNEPLADLPPHVY